MALRIIWSHTAVEDIKGIVEYIALDAPDAAANLADRILAQIETAAELPFSNRAVPEKADGSIREAILKPYRIIYDVDDRRLGASPSWYGGFYKAEDGIWSATYS